MMKSLNRFLSVLLVLVLFAAPLTACSGNRQETAASSEPSAEAADTDMAESSAASGASASGLEAKPIVRVGALKGPTSMGMVGLMDQSARKQSKNIYEFTVAGAPDEVAGKIISGELDIAAVPTNLAAVLYNKTEKKVQVLAVNTLGVLYILTKDETVSSVNDLKGKTIYATGQGASPEYVLDYILAGNGLEPGRDVTVEYLGEHAELASKMLAGSANIAMLPQPFVTTVTQKDDQIETALDLTEEWNKVTDGAELVMGCIVVRSDFAEKNPAAVANFLEEYRASTDYVNANVDEAAALVETYDILPAAVAQKAIPLSNIVYMDGDDMRNSLQAFFQVLFDKNPAAVGGAMPDDAFYYKKS